MNTQIIIDNGSRSYSAAIAGMVFLVAVALLLAGCGGGGSSTAGGDGGGGGGCLLTVEEIEAIGNINDLPPECLALLPVPENNLLGRIFILGTQVDPASGALRIFANGTDSDGNPLQLADFQTATVTVAGNPADPGLVSVEPVAAGDDVLSLGFVTDYSTSISDAELNAISMVYSLVLDSLSPPNLPQVLEGEVINFSDSVVLQQDWSEDAALLQAAFQLDDSFLRGNTAFYDALGVSLQRDLALDNDGLVERCRPAHLLIAFTDGAENASVVYTKDTLLPIIDDSRVVTIMLGSLNADKDALIELAGDRGAFAYAYNLAGIQNVAEDWAGSLSHMVKFTLDPATGFDTGAITIVLGGEAIVVERPVDGFCESAP
ncbi:MAG: VWA domain-containing protein [Gammaproteobacteria bacterium]|nr:VWA domain-containing protein [Gammaproteobacteria bacterium]